MSAYSPAANNKLPAGWIFMKFDIWVFFKILPRKFKFLKVLRE
jgi:hypothetical protein